MGVRKYRDAHRPEPSQRNPGGELKLVLTTEAQRARRSEFFTTKRTKITKASPSIRRGSFSKPFPGRSSATSQSARPGKPSRASPFATFALFAVKDQTSVLFVPFVVKECPGLLRTIAFSSHNP